MNDLAAQDMDAYEEALPHVARRLGLDAHDLDARCRVLLGADRALWRDLLPWPLVGGAALALAAACLWALLSGTSPLS